MNLPMLALAVCLVSLASACQTDVTEGPRPSVVCGTTMWSKGATPAIFFTYRQPSTVHHGWYEGAVFVRVAAGCRRGSEVTLSPASAYRIVKSAHSRDGRLAAIELLPVHRTRTLVTATRDGKPVGSLIVDVKGSIAHQPTPVPASPRPSPSR